MLWKGRGALKSDAALRVLRHITGIATKWNFCCRQQKFQMRAPLMNRNGTWQAVSSS